MVTKYKLGLLGHLEDPRRGILDTPRINTITFPVEGYTRKTEHTDTQKNILALYGKVASTREEIAFYLEHQPHSSNPHALIVRWEKHQLKEDPIIGWVPTSISRIICHHLDQITQVTLTSIGRAWSNKKETPWRPTISLKYNRGRHDTKEPTTLSTRIKRAKCQDEQLVSPSDLNH